METLAGAIFFLAFSLIGIVFSVLIAWWFMKILPRILDREDKKKK